MTAKTAASKLAVLAALAEVVTVRAAADRAGVSRKTVYQWLKDDPEFAEAFTEVDEANVQRAEERLWQLAVDGVDEPVFYRGDVVGEIRKFDPGSLQFLLKARRPAVYRDRATVEHTGPGGGPVKIEHGHDLSKLSADELRSLHGLLSKAEGEGASGG